MNWQGRELDPLSLWQEYVDFPSSMDAESEFSPLVQCPNPDHVTSKRHFQGR